MALVLLLVSCALAELVPAPIPHLIPPPASATAALNHDSATASAKSRSLEICSPCDRVPWIPMARSLNLDTQHYALSVPAVPLKLPVSYGIPITRLHLSDHQPPPEAQHSPPTAGGTRAHNAEQPQVEDKPGLPPPPLPQFSYQTPQSLVHTQHVSESNINVNTQKLLHPPPPAFLNYQLLPSYKFGPPFHSKSPVKTNIPKPSVTYLPENPQKPSKPALSHNPKPPVNYLPQKPTSFLTQNAPPTNGGQHVIHGTPQQYQGGLLKTNFFLQNPIPFPTMSKIQLPPLLNYQTFHDGKRNQLYSYLQPPKPQDVSVTISESDDSCKKCQEQKQSSDSEPAQAEHVTEHLVTTTEKHETSKEPSTEFETPKQNFQVVKSVPLAEYLASIEYPMQIVQAPILDVPELTKYFNLGYHNFQQGHIHPENDTFKLQDINPAQSFASSNIQNAENYNQNVNFSSRSPLFQQSSSTNLNGANLPKEHTTNNLPHNHKHNIHVLSENEDTTDRGHPSTLFQNTAFPIHETTRPSQIYHISKITPLPHTDSAIHTTELPLSQTFSTTGGHFVTTQPLTELQPPKSGDPAPFQEPINSPSQPQSLSAPGIERFPTGPVNFKFNAPSPPNSSGSLRDWEIQPYGRGWGNTLPHPFEMPTTPPHRARFENRPSPTPNKKAKHIHQIIVPYTTSKQKPTLAQDPANTIGWTPIPPTNQGRKVPANDNIGDQFSSSTGFDQTYSYQNINPTGNPQFSANIPFSASGSDNLASQQILPSSNVQNYLPPHIINQILHNPAGAVWPTGSEGLQQLLTTNLQSLLRGEEDSIDITSLQKNIDNWTAEGYKQNSPSVNYIPATTISHILNSKKIPSEYLTSTEPTSPSSQPDKVEHSVFYQHSGVLDDNEGAASLRHQIKIHPNLHDKDQGPLKETESITEAGKEDVVETTPKVWENVQVSISPLTKEKVYVVTPVPTTVETPLSTSSA